MALTLPIRSLLMRPPALVSVLLFLSLSFAGGLVQLARLVGFGELLPGVAERCLSAISIAEVLSHILGDHGPVWFPVPVPGFVLSLQHLLHLDGALAEGTI